MWWVPWLALRRVARLLRRLALRWVPWLTLWRRHVPWCRLTLWRVARLTLRWIAWLALWWRCVTWCGGLTLRWVARLALWWRCVSRCGLALRWVSRLWLRRLRHDIPLDHLRRGPRRWFRTKIMRHDAYMQFGIRLALCQ